MNLLINDKLISIMLDYLGNVYFNDNKHIYQLNFDMNEEPELFLCDDNYIEKIDYYQEEHKSNLQNKMDIGDDNHLYEHYPNRPIYNFNNDDWYEYVAEDTIHYITNNNHFPIYEFKEQNINSLYDFYLTNNNNVNLISSYSNDYSSLYTCIINTSSNTLIVKKIDCLDKTYNIIDFLANNLK